MTNIGNLPRERHRRPSSPNDTEKTEEARLKRVSAARSPTIGTPPSRIKRCRRCG